MAGRFWRWHINFCPGWKSYFLSLSKEEQSKLASKYNFFKNTKMQNNKFYRSILARPEQLTENQKAISDR
jgi:hypothetical protein